MAQFFAGEALSVTTSSTSMTAATYSNANYATVHVQVAPVRFRLDATAPTATVGDILEVGDRLTLETADEIVRFRAIAKDGVSATLFCQYAVRT